LRRELGLRDVVLFNLAAVIGIRWLAAAAQAGPGSITLWLAAALLFFVPSALAVSLLSTRYPEEGGIYVWTKYAFGEWHGFLCGWCYWLSNLFYFPNLLLAGVAMAGYAAGASQNKAQVVAIALAILWIALLANMFGLSVGKWVNNLGGLSTYAAGALIIALGAAAWLGGGAATPMRLAPKMGLDSLNFWSQIAFAFGGLELGAVMGGEIRNPRRTVPRAAWISGLAIAAFYILGTLALLALLPPGSISILTGLVEAGTAAGTRLGIRWLGPPLTFLVLAGVAGQLGAWIGGCARIPFVIGLDHHLPRVLARVHPRWQTPYWSILFQGAVCTVFLMALQAGEDLRIAYQLLVDMTVITYFIPFLYLFSAAWKQGQRGSALSGLAVTALSIVLSLVPPSDVASVWLFEAKLLGGCAALIAAAKIVFIRSRPAQ
jgi:glutamate:GABA antiporter